MSSKENLEAQEKFCSENKLPLFASETCWHCGCKVFECIDLQKASNELITGCPNCSTSFCE